MAELSFKLFSETGEEFSPEKIISYELASSVSAPCDGLRLSWLSDSPIDELSRVEAYIGDGLIFSGCCDTQREENAGDGTKCFIYARSSACILTDNEAMPSTYDAPTAGSLFIINAEKYGFSFSMEDVACSGKYTVRKGCSCYSAVNRLVSSVTGRNIRITPDGRLVLPEGETVTLDCGRVISFKKTVNRGAPLSQIDYKTSADSSYLRHIKSRYFERKGITRAKKVNLSSLFDWERGIELKRMLREAAAEYEKLEITLSGAQEVGLYDEVTLDGYETQGYRVSSLLRILDKSGARTVITLTREHGLEEIMYVD